ncbi:hypothetical protein G7Y79_00008g024490 [Physcia stellaris]|nr:hypothetical protein G7Y79_00008g024490 [Physcia stellaris]
MASVFYPNPVQAAINLRTATLFTRINVRADPQRVNAAFAATPNVRNSFSLGHLSDILVFDSAQPQHTAHVKDVLQMLRDNKLRIDVNRCAFDKPSWTEAGFHIEPVGEKKECFMVLLQEQIRKSEPKAETQGRVEDDVESEIGLNSEPHDSAGLFHSLVGCFGGVLVADVVRAAAMAVNTKAARNKKKNDKRKEKKAKAKRDSEAQGIAEEESTDRN